MLPTLTDLTPTVAIVYETPRASQGTSLSPGEPQEAQFRADATNFVALREPIFPSARSMREAPATSAVESSPMQEGTGVGDTNDAVLRARDMRLALLAKRYAGTHRIEDEARFKILTEQLRRLAPRVTAQDFEPIRDALDAVEAMDAEVLALRTKRAMR